MYVRTLEVSQFAILIKLGHPELLIAAQDVFRHLIRDTIMLFYFIRLGSQVAISGSTDISIAITT